MLQSYDERNADIRYWVNGVLRHRDEPGISPFDSVGAGRRRGLGGAAAVRRARSSGSTSTSTGCAARRIALAFAEIPPTRRSPTRSRRTLRANEMRDGVHIRLTLTRGVKVTSGMDPRLNQAGPTLIVLAEHKPPVYDTAGLTLVTASVRRPRPGRARPEDPPHQPAQLDPGEDRGQRRRRRRRADARRPRLRRRDQRHAPVRRRRRARCVTPRTVACPEGITRQTVLELCRAARRSRAAVRDVSLAEVYRADEVFCTGTMGELAGVTTIDGRPIGDGRGRRR